MSNIVVYSPGRTGSTLISNTLSSFFKKTFRPIGLDTSRIFEDNLVIATHNPLFLPENLETSIAVISHRKNLFDTVMSKIIADHTQEFHIYSGKELKIEITDVEFSNMYDFCKSFYEILDTSKFKTVVKVEFEEMFADPKYLLSKFNENFTMSYGTNPSPYKKDKVVSNLEHCRKLFAEKELVPLENYINFVRADLERY